MLRILNVVALTLCAGQLALGDEPVHEAELVFPLHPQHNHAPGLVECPNGDLLVSWFRGSGERRSDDVAGYGARRRKGEKAWSEPFVMNDTPGFPDGNTAMHIDQRGRLWFFWPVVVANTWESVVSHYRISTDYQGDGPPKWSWQSPLWLRPMNFEEEMLKGLEHRMTLSENDQRFSQERLDRIKKLIADKLSSRLGWQVRCKPTVLPSGRILLPLYSDTYSVGLMAISDDHGQTWFASKPLAGFGSIQPSVVRRNNGILVAYMRETGSLDRIRVSESTDDGVSWGPVGMIDFPNPGSGLDAVRLGNSHWALIYNDTTRGRNSLAVSLSDDEGRTWAWTRHLERHESGSYHYPVLIQARDGRLHAVYSYFVPGGKSMKHAAFNEAWIKHGD